jgi:hypothetical protein
MNAIFAVCKTCGKHAATAREEFQSTLPAMVSLKQRVTELRSGGSSSNHSALVQWSD